MHLRLSLGSCLLLAFLPLAACTIALKDMPLDGPQAAPAGALRAAPSASGIPARA